MPGGAGTAISGAGGTSGTSGGYQYGADVAALYQLLVSMGFTAADAQATLEENRRQFDDELEYSYWAAKQTAATSRANAASAAAAGNEEARISAEASMHNAETAAASALQIAQLDVASREHIADEDLGMRLKEMQSKERITAAETWANPIDYLAYNKWLSGQQALTNESGLPMGAQPFDTGLPQGGTVGSGQAATTDVYGQQLAAGQRIPQFNAWGGETTDVGGTPWQAPHETNITQFSNLPYQAQQMAYARWRQRGITPESALGIMTAAAPVGTAKSLVAYG